MHRIALSEKYSEARRLARRAGAAALLAVSAALAGCASAPAPVHNRYDLGDLPARGGAGSADSAALTPAAPGAVRAAALVVPDVRAPSDLDSDRIRYRLRYRSDLETRSYTASNWTMTPAQLLTQRLRSRLALRYPVVANQGSGGAPVLQIDLLRFEQVFDQIAVGHGVVALRATLSRNGTVLAQHEFEAQAPSATPDAAGGAASLAQASDTAGTALLSWLATQPIR